VLHVSVANFDHAEEGNLTGRARDVRLSRDGITRALLLYNAPILCNMNSINKSKPWWFTGSFIYFRVSEPASLVTDHWSLSHLPIPLSQATMAKLASFLLASAYLVSSGHGMPLGGAKRTQDAPVAREATLSGVSVTTSYSTPIKTLQSPSTTVESSVTGVIYYLVYFVKVRSLTHHRAS
jgi:hypothetical protein